MTPPDFTRCISVLLDHIKDSLPEVPNEAGEVHVPAGDFLPQWLLDEHNLMPWLDALSVVHDKLAFSHSEEARKEARRRMVFNECLLLSLMMLHYRVRILLSDRSEQPPVICKNQVTARCWLCWALVLLFNMPSSRVLVALLFMHVHSVFCDFTIVDVCCVLSSCCPAVGARTLLSVQTLTALVSMELS
jgi:hypothetical protein